MKRIAVTSLSCLLVLGLAACDKKSDEADKTAANDKEAAKTDDAAKEAAKKTEDKPAEEAKPEAEAKKDEKDDTKGIGGVIHEVADDEAAPGAEAAAAGAEAAAAGADAAAAGAEAVDAAAAGDAEAAAKAAAEAAKAAEEAAKAAAADAPHYDTSKDSGGLIGHLASGLAHDDELAAAGTKAELAKLAGEEEDLGPSDAEICEHVLTEILIKELGEVDDELKEEFLDTCKEEVEKERVKLGPDIFRQQADCIMAAQDLEAIEVCDAAEEEAEEDLEDHPHGHDATEEQCVAAVDHIFELVKLDLGDDPDLIAILDEDIETLKEDAVLSCLVEATPEELACAIKAEKLEDLESCE